MKTRAILSFFALGFFVCSCSLTKASEEPKLAQTTQEEWTTSFEDLKHEIHCVKMDIQLLESRLQNEVKNSDEQKLSKKELQQDFYEALSKVEKKVSELEKKESKISQDVFQLSEHSNQVTSSLNLTQTQMASLSERIEEILKLNQSLQVMIQSLKKEDVKKGQTYTVQAGDSLEKIAKKFQVNLDDLKKENHLEGDKILAGQDLVIPALRW